MSLLGNKKDGKEELVLICDIGSARVAGALALIQKNHPPHILYRTEKRIVFQEDLDFERFTLSMIEALDWVLKDISTQGLSHIYQDGRKKHKKAPRIARALCVYASPWHLSQTKVLRHKAKKEFTVTQELIDAIIEREGKNFEEHELAEYGESIGARMELIEQQITCIKLEGYSVNSPIGRKTKEVSFIVTITMMASALREAVTEKVTSQLHTDDISHHSFGYTSFIALRDTLENVGDFLLVDVTGEISDVLLVQDDILLSSVSFPYGSRNVIRNVAHSKNVNIETAQSLVKTHAREHSANEEGGEMRDALDKWNMHFVDALNTIQSVGPVPKNVLCVVDEDMGSIFQDTISDALKQFGIPPGKDTIQRITTGTLGKNTTFRAGITEDPFISLAALYADRLHNALATNK